jgi:hypothetical protein
MRSRSIIELFSGKLCIAVACTAVIGIFIVLTEPQRLRARRLKTYETCHRSQRHVSNALCLWRLDSARSADRFDETMPDRLVKEGYLKSFPRHPEHGPSCGIIEVGPTGNGVLMCREHGTWNPSMTHGDTPRDQMKSLGMVDPELLRMASTDRIPVWDQPRGPMSGVIGTGELCLFGGLLLFGSFLASVAIGWWIYGACLVIGLVLEWLYSWAAFFTALRARTFVCRACGAEQHLDCFEPPA